MWNLVAASKLTQQAERKRNYEHHKNALKNIRPILNIQKPEQPDFVYAKPKAKMARNDRLLEIDKQNQILLNKMTSLQKEPPQNQLRPESQWLKTLNQQTNNTLRERIDAENRRICNKLMVIPSHYPTAQIVGQTHQLLKIRLSISQNARRINGSRCSLSRPQSATLLASKFVRSGQKGLLGDSKLEATTDRSARRSSRPGSAPGARIARNSSVPGNLFLQSLADEEEIV